jgi:hypothetical protein
LSLNVDNVGDNTHKDEQQRTLRKNRGNYEMNNIEENELRKKFIFINHQKHLFFFLSSK